MRTLDTSSTIRQFKQDDIARIATLRFQKDQTSTDRNDHVMGVMRNLAQKTFENATLPKSVGEWVSLVLFYGDEPLVMDLREQAEADAQASYVQAERWLALIDHARHQAGS